jgi:putative transposase
MDSGHRKRLKRHDVTGHARELTFSTFERRPLLADPIYARTALEAIARACVRHACPPLAFVVMPEHVHLLVMPERRTPEEPPPIPALLAAIKRPSSYRIKTRLAEVDPALLDDLTIREHPAKTAFRFWQEGAGYDRNITNPETLRRSIEYIHANPVRRALCRRPEEYPWSSARQWSHPDEPIPEWMPRIDRTAAG